MIHTPSPTIIETQGWVLPAHDAKLELQDLVMDVSDLAEDEVVLELVASGICHSDLSVVNGTISGWPKPCVLGHEGAGKVVAVGSAVKHVQPGDSALTSWVYCENCTPCNRLKPMYCQNWIGMNVTAKRTNGVPGYKDKSGETVYGHFLGQTSFARHMVIHKSGVHKSTAKDLELMAPMGCGLITGAGTVFNELKPEKGSTILVYGVGAVGASAIMAAACHPVSAIIAVDLLPARLEMAREIGATHIINGKSDDVAAEVKKITNGLGVDYIIDAVGSAFLLKQGYDLLAGGGTLASVGIPKAGTTLELDVTLHVNFGKKFIGVLEGSSNPSEFMGFLDHLHSQGRFPFDKLCKKFPASDINKAFDAMKTGEVIKPIIVW